jgi:hypothetical protein
MLQGWVRLDIEDRSMAQLLISAGSLVAVSMQASER